MVCLRRGWMSEARVNGWDWEVVRGEMTKDLSLFSAPDISG